MKRISPLSAKLITFIFLISLFFIAIISLLIIYRENQGGDVRMEKTFHIIETTHLDSLSESIFNFDDRYVEIQLEGIASLEHVVFVYLEEYRSDGTLIRELGDRKHKIDAQRIYPLRYHMTNGKTEELGTLIIHANLDTVKKELKLQLRRVIFEQGILVLLLSLTIFILTQRTITRYLGRFAQYANSMNLTHLSENLNLDRALSKPPFGRDELDELEKALNEMRIRMEKELLEKETLEDEMKVLEQNYLHAQKVDSIGKMTGRIAHDLNNLLSPIIGLSELLVRKLDGTEYTASLEGIYQAGTRAADLVEKLLSYSRRRNVEKKAINLNDVIGDFMSLINSTLRKDITIKTNLSEEIKPIFSDEGQLAQILMNLSVNAQDAIEGEGTICIETTPLDLDEGSREMYEGLMAGQYVLMTFSDNGSGMDRKTREKIFDPYYSTKGDSGTGLGLSTVYSIVMEHKGKLFVYSEPGHGTTFKFFFPVSENQEDPRLFSVPENLIKSDGSETILIVEEDELVRSFTVSILRNYGYYPIAVERGSQALEYLKESDDFALLMTAMVMEGTSGIELINEAHTIRPNLPVLFMTGYNEDYSEQLKENDINLIQKPFTINQLIKAISRTLKKTINSTS
ncbi:MAG: ATP-binding protein [Spirochaetales bacterium]|nr:ATP-binding protein [Spirochaetales bacterium]